MPTRPRSQSCHRPGGAVVATFAALAAAAVSVLVPPSAALAGQFPPAPVTTDAPVTSPLAAVPPPPAEMEVDAVAVANAARRAKTADIALSAAAAQAATWPAHPGTHAAAARRSSFRHDGPQYVALLIERDAALTALARLVSSPADAWVLARDWRRMSIEQRSRFLDAFVAARYRARPDVAVVDACPSVAPPGTLRAGAQVIGVEQLCERSVAAAPTREAALAIRYAFFQLGTPYDVARRNQAGFFDCSSLVMRAYAQSGVPGIVRGGSLTTRTIAPYEGFQSVPWLVDIPWLARQPGDLLLTPPNRPDGGGHVMITLVDGFVIHAPGPGDVVHIRTEYPVSDIDYVRRPLLSLVDPEDRIVSADGVTFKTAESSAGKRLIAALSVEDVSPSPAQAGASVQGVRDSRVQAVTSPPSRHRPEVVGSLGLFGLWVPFRW